MKLPYNMFRAVALALATLLATALPEAALSQTVVQLPRVVGSSVLDLGNGPLELKVVQGNAIIGTSQSGGTSGNAISSSTALTVTTTPTSPPCVGCVIYGTGITAGTTVTATSGTSITLSAAMTVSTSTTLTWGAACPSSLSSGTFMQASVGGDWPLYTYARICAQSPNGPGAMVLPFAIGAH